MTDAAPRVLFCEGEQASQSIDFRLYSLLFDANKIEVRPMEGGCEGVRVKTKPAQSASEVLRSPRHYFGIRDRDRNFGIAQRFIVILPIAEIENLFWVPKLWPLFHKMLKALGKNVSEDHVRQKKNEFWNKFRSLLKTRMYYYMSEYAQDHYKNLHQEKQPRKNQRNDRIRDHKDNPEEIHQIMNKY
ncbi:unnamed protein product [Didymodactylos carnosus]|uniref:Uncharacterized protein n=1 Tax=Didymodactylos carnosus TaxID=1234261 RepID=A0A815LG44_9BILA|nr:unnamed protein product [Didymodactylos carnosus]CAF1402863.1 unnamed protein product [Didymodactylos carnosus]CAF3848715.1 unnamed protein product [Didymodactylos carnosus]CAF4295874.1 unnamed protein product [Didymodactylos carnosus]